MKASDTRASATVLNDFLRKCLEISLFVMLFIATVFPTGQFYGLNIKLLVLVIVTGLLTLDLIANRRTYLTLCICLASYILFILTYACWGIIIGNEPSDVITHIAAISGTFLIVFLPYYAMRIEAISVRKLFNYILIIAILHCIIKIFIEILLLLGFINIQEFQAWLYAVFNFEVITLKFGGLIRINSANDFIMPVCTFGLLTGKRYGIIKYPHVIVALILSLFIFSTYLTYSRFLWVLAGIALLFGVTILLKGSIDKGKMILLACIVTVSVMAIVFFLPEQVSLLDVIAKRYTGIDAENSDLDRLVMKPFLYEKFLDSPYFGHGLGAYVEKYVRFDYLPWNYELHWLALLMQVGILGILYQSVYYFIMFRKLYLGANLVTLGLYSLLFMILVSGVFNCFIFTSAMGVVFLFLIVTAVYTQSFIEECPYERRTCQVIRLD